MKATAKQIAYITILMGKTYEAEYDKLTKQTASELITAIKCIKNMKYCGIRKYDDSADLWAWDNLCRAEQKAFGHNFNKPVEWQAA